MIGGYQIIDFKNINLASGTQTVAGIWNLITKTDKPILVKNLVISESLTIRNAFMSFNDDGSGVQYLASLLAIRGGMTVNLAVNIMDQVELVSI